MPPKRSTKKGRSYGRQAEGRTIKSLSLDAEIAQWAERLAAAEGISFSRWVEIQLEKTRTENQPKNVINYAAPRPAESEPLRVAEDAPRKKKPAH